MAFYWDTKAVKQHIEANVSHVKEVSINSYPGGDYDSLGMVVSLTNGKSFNITPWRDCIDKLRGKPQILDGVNVKFIEMADSNADGRGGLQSKNKELAEAFIEVRQHFLDNGVKDVIRHYDEIY